MNTYLNYKKLSLMGVGAMIICLSSCSQQAPPFDPSMWDNVTQAKVGADAQYDYMLMKSGDRWQVKRTPYQMTLNQQQSGVAQLSAAQSKALNEDLKSLWNQPQSKNKAKIQDGAYISFMGGDNQQFKTNFFEQNRKSPSEQVELKKIMKVLNKQNYQ